MSDNSIISVRNGVISAVLAGIILTIIVPAIREHAVKFLTWLWFGVLWCWNALISSYSLPGWAWIIVFLFSIVGAITIFQALRPIDKPDYVWHMSKTICLEQYGAGSGSKIAFLIYGVIALIVMQLSFAKWTQYFMKLTFYAKIAVTLS